MRTLAVSLMLTAALFSGVVMGVMIVTRLSEPAVPPDSPTLQSLRAALAQDSSNEVLKEALREEDQQARQDFFTHRRRLAVGAYLLLAGLAATVICARWYASLERKTPRPTTPAEREDADRWLARRRRNIIAVAVVSVAVLVGFLIFGLAGGPPIAPAPFAGQATPQTVAPSAATTPPAESAFKENWPRFRGPDGTGLVKADDWPQKWDAATGENILWKTPVPMPGNSSPVLWGDRLFLTGAERRHAGGPLLRRAPPASCSGGRRSSRARGDVKAEDITVRAAGSDTATPRRRRRRTASASMRPSPAPTSRRWISTATSSGRATWESRRTPRTFLRPRHFPARLQGQGHRPVRPRPGAGRRPVRHAGAGREDRQDGLEHAAAGPPLLVHARSSSPSPAAPSWSPTAAPGSSRTIRTTAANSGAAPG